MNNGVMPSRKDAIMSNYPFYERVCDYKLLMRSHKQATKGPRKYRKEVVLFDMAREKNLVELWRSLKDETYRPGEYIRFEVKRPKARVVSAPRMTDKIVQYAVHCLLWEIYEPVYIKDTYACLVERGAHRAVDKVQHNMRQCVWKYGDCWILKIDIKKYFYTVDRDVLKTVYRKKVTDEKFLRLLDMIVDSSPEGDKGIPLGNVTSQDFATIYLNELDQFCKRYLNIEFYVRYMDDVCIMVPSKLQAEQLLKIIEKYLREHLRLALNTKTRIFPVSQGVNAYGYKIHTTHRLVRNSSKAAAKRRIKALDRKLKAGEITQNKVTQCVNSWLGHARHSNSYNLAKKVYAGYDYVKVEHKNYKFGVRLDEH